MLWRRPLGDGYSAIVSDGKTLYTMHRHSTGARDGREVVIALDAETGQTSWEYAYREPLSEKMNTDYGPGPLSTPLIAGDRLFAVGAMGKLHALDSKTGQLLWSRDLYNEFSMQRIGMKTNRGYSSSPMACGDNLILPVGGEGQAVVAFRQSDGSVAWQRHDFQLSPSSPLLIDVDGQEQLILFTAAEIIGLNPENGDLYWSHPHKTEYDLNISMPVWGEDNLLYMSSAYDGGSRVVELNRADGGDLGSRALVQQAHASSLRVYDPTGRRDLRVQRRLWTGLLHGRGREDRADSVAPERSRQDSDRFCRRQVPDRGRRWPPGSGETRGEKSECPFEGGTSRVAGLDRSHSGQNSSLSARPEIDHGPGSGAAGFWVLGSRF